MIFLDLAALLVDILQIWDEGLNLLIEDSLSLWLEVGDDNADLKYEKYLIERWRIIGAEFALTWRIFSINISSWFSIFSSVFSDILRAWILPDSLWKRKSYEFVNRGTWFYYFIDSRKIKRVDSENRVRDSENRRRKSIETLNHNKNFWNRFTEVFAQANSNS